MPRPSLAGTTVVITGGARGIGRATVDRLVRRGARVAIGDLDGVLAAEVAADYGDAVVGTALDVADPESWAVFRKEVAHLGPCDILINNAGIMPLGPVLAEDADVTRSIVDVNLHGVINGTKAFGPEMVKRGHGHIINVASAVGRIALAGGATYSASKFAVVGFTEAVRQELAPSGIEVSMVLPTVVLTELSTGVAAAKGVKKVTADQVAAVIESAIDSPRPELWVPRWTQAISRINAVLPRRAQEALAHAMGADRALSNTDPSARLAYENRVRHRD